MRTVRNILITQEDEKLPGAIITKKKVIINGDEEFTIDEMMYIVSCINCRIHRHSMELNYTINDIHKSKTLIKR